MEPLLRVMPETDQEEVPEAVPLPPVLLAQVTWVTPTLSEAEPARLRELELVLYVEAVVGEVMDTVGGVASGGVYVTVSVAVPELAAASLALTVMILEPLLRVMPETDQLDVPEAVPLPPVLLAQVT